MNRKCTTPQASLFGQNRAFASAKTSEKTDMNDTAALTPEEIALEEAKILGTLREISRPSSN